MTHADRNAPEPAAPAGLLPHSVEQKLDFSFSGLKTAVLRLVKELTAGGRALSDEEKRDICASFQRVVVAALLDRTFEAARWLGAKSIGISGGVSANSRLRDDAAARGERFGIPVFVPPLSLSTDNAAMIGAAALRKLTGDAATDWSLNAHASLPL
jgi:N6-L-threonylcarbamoyladenine synthase